MTVNFLKQKLPSRRLVIGAVMAVAWGGVAEVVDCSLAVPDATVKKVVLRLWELTSVTNAEVRPQSVDFNVASQYRAPTKQQTFSVLNENGTSFLRMDEDGKGAFRNGVRPTRPFDVHAGVRYTLRFFARCTAGSGMVYLQFLDACGANISDKVAVPEKWTYTPWNKAVYCTCRPQPNWQEQSLPFLVPEGVCQVIPVLAPWIDGKSKNLDFRSPCLDGDPFRTMREEVRFGQRAVAPDESVELTSAASALSLKASVVADGMGAYKIGVTVSDIANPPRPRALQVAVEWPHDLAGWTWHRDWRRDETIAKGASLRECHDISGLQVGSYPFTAVSKNGCGLALGTELDDPAFECGTVTAGGICSVRALGLLKRGEKGTSASLSWLVLPFRGDWGFRSATKAYYVSQARKIPQVKVGAQEGTRSYLGVQASQLPDDVQDYGLAYYIPNGGVKERQLAREKGMLVHPYILAWQIPSAHYADYNQIPSMDERLAELQRWLSVTNERAHRNFGTCKRDLAQVLLNSIPLQADGGRPLSLEWYDGVVHYWRLNVDPRLPEPNASSTFCGNIDKWGLDTIDGVYLDNVYVQQFNNVRPDHLAVMSEPLVYDPATARPCAQAMQHQVAFVKMLGDWLHPLDKRVTGNVFPGGAYRFNATIIDVFGCETGFAGTGTNRSERLRTPSPDSSSCEKRFFAYRRPVSDMLQSGNWTTPVEAITAAGITNYVEHHLFYGFYPGIVTIGGEDFPGYRGWKRYFGKARQCERDRALFAQVIPLIRRLNRAGWMPETLLRSDNAKVLIERYGDLNGECLFTVRNASNLPIKTTLRPDASFGSVTKLHPLWRGDGEITLRNGVFRMRLEPWTTAVFRAE